jgi:hypothetical protein
MITNSPPNEFNLINKSVGLRQKKYEDICIIGVWYTVGDRQLNKR